MIEQARELKKLLAVERARLRLKQRLDAINWEYDFLKPKVAKFLGQAQLPELPSIELVEIIDEDVETPSCL